MFYGYIDHRWRRQQESFLIRKQGDPTKAHSWAIRLIEFLWEQSYDIWKLRNSETHDDKITPESFRRNEVIHKLDEVYQMGKDMNAQDRRALLSKPLAAIKEQSTKLIQRWIDHNEPRIKTCAKRNTTQEKKQNRNIRSYLRR